MGPPIGQAAHQWLDLDPAEVRLGVAVTRRLLIDVFVTGEVEAATEALVLFVDRWRPGAEGT